jgi:transcriptional regulator with XRE-family HTH domain
MLLGDRLRECREKKKMTQQELAEKTGFSRGSIINWEKGIRIPNADILKKLAEALGVTVSYLMGETDMYHENIKRGSIQPVIEIPILNEIEHCPKGIFEVVVLLGNCEETMLFRRD